MARANAGLLMVVLLFLLPSSVTRAADSAAEAKRAAEVRKKLEATIDFSGFPDPDTKFEDALAYLQRIVNVSFEINQKAFNEEMIENLAEKPIGRTFPKMTNISVERVLPRILERVPSPSGATFVVRGGVVEITTRRQASPLRWRWGQVERVNSDEELPSPKPPEITFAFEKRDLRDALQEIADATGVNIVLDGRAQDKGRTPITATMRNAGVPSALTVLADMADLAVVPLEDAVYVTTKENAKTMRSEREKTEMKPTEPAQPKM
jgi:hypothetical protein